MTVSCRARSKGRKALKFAGQCRADRTGVLHAAFGKCSFPTEHLYANLGTLAAAVLASRPKGVKGGGAPPRSASLAYQALTFLQPMGFSLCRTPFFVAAILHWMHRI